MKLVFDIETNGFLDALTKIHSLVIKNVETGEVWSCFGDYYKEPASEGCTRASIESGLELLMKADLLIGHNIIGFDLPAIQKVYPSFTYDEAKVFDTLILSRLLWPAIFDTDVTKIKRGKTSLTMKLAGTHGLEAWGHRVGKWKGDYAKIMKDLGRDPWAEWNHSMQEYCEQDVEVNEALYRLIIEKELPTDAIKLEHQIAFIMAQVERNGFSFDTEAAEALYVKLAMKREEMCEELRSVFAPWFSKDGGVVTPKRPNSKYGYWGEGTGKDFKGYPYQKVKLKIFNPNSRDQIADRLQTIHGWKPEDFTPKGKPKVDETILSALKYPEASQLATYMLLQKRIGQLAEGENAWLKVVCNGRIHGSINTNATVTGRASHSNPNIAQVPSVGAEYGEECRALFRATPGSGRVMLGCDVSGLELRMLGHFIAKHDGGAYAEEVVNGDVHSTNASALFGMDTAEFKAGLKDEDPISKITQQIEEAYKWLRKQPEDIRERSLVRDFYKHLRNTAKTFIYAFLYGAGDAKIGSIIGKGAKAGKALKAKFFKRFPALKKLIDGVQAKAKGKGSIKGLDGRKLHIRSSHSALNTLLQSAGAIVCKQWIVEFVRLLRDAGLYELVKIVAWVHDELQMEVPEALADQVGELCVRAILIAGEKLGIRVPLTGEYSTGMNWKETH